MDADAVFRRYDIRGEYKQEIDEEFAERLGKAVGTHAIREYGGEVTVCRDNKISSIPLKKALLESIASTGADIYDAGKGPTDYAALTGNRFGTVSVQVTSSHLPLSSNGFKLMYPEGNGFQNPDLDKVEELFKSQSFEKGAGNATKVEKASKNSYKEDLLEYLERFPGNLDGKKVVVEPLGGVARKLLPELLEEAGAEVVDLSEEQPKGPYFDPPKPEPERLEHVEEAVKKHEADIGVATDMDADRAVFYFEGSWLTGDEVFAILAQLFDNPDTVASIDSSKAVEEIVEENDRSIHYTRVGDPFVLDKALEVNAELAGEPNGHYSFPVFVAYNSGILSALLMAKIDTGELLAKVPKYQVESREVEIEEKQNRLEKVVETVRNEFKIESEIDGVKYRDGEASVLIRSSGSSPLLRVKAEAKTHSEALTAVEQAEQLIRNP